MAQNNNAMEVARLELVIQLVPPVGESGQFKAELHQKPAEQPTQPEIETPPEEPKKEPTEAPTKRPTKKVYGNFTRTVLAYVDQGVTSGSEIADMMGEEPSRIYPVLSYLRKQNKIKGYRDNTEVTGKGKEYLQEALA